MKITKDKLRIIIREMVEETFQSHSDEPEVGELVVNINPDCQHKGSEGIVMNINTLPDDAGKTAEYMCTNDGPTWGAGDMLEKTLDQLTSIMSLEDMDKSP